MPSGLHRLKDRAGKGIIAARINRLKAGNFGDIEPIGGGLSEMRIHFGPGYRVYLKQAGRVVVVVLCGGDKST